MRLKGRINFLTYSLLKLEIRPRLFKLGKVEISIMLSCVIIPVWWPLSGPMIPSVIVIRYNDNVQLCSELLKWLLAS